MHKFLLIFSSLIALSAHAEEKQYYNWKLTQENKVLHLEIKDSKLKGETDEVKKMLETSGSVNFCGVKEEILALKSKDMPNMNGCKVKEQSLTAEKSDNLLVCDEGGQGVRLVLETQGNNIVGQSDVLIDTPQLLMRGKTTIFIEQQESCKP